MLFDHGHKSLLQTEESFVNLGLACLVKAFIAVEETVTVFVSVTDGLAINSTVEDGLQARGLDGAVFGD